MALTDIQTIKPSKSGIFLLALPLIVFIFFFTQQEAGREVM
ncbi:hypothetical protein IQ10_03450 [Halalkalibacter nanhaiisediminis]|uniref:Uncharacterized protein n=1 Tax=Halalkalibacter nanhaiisediminis TaxID=688079 RepID=A0A562Q974_9BACI|nr:hypothetical protein IQ10_03450 [Halalkalibacter nanhaiisediminis]